MNSSGKSEKGCRNNEFCYCMTYDSILLILRFHSIQLTPQKVQGYLPIRKKMTGNLNLAFFLKLHFKISQVLKNRINTVSHNKTV